MAADKELVITEGATKKKKVIIIGAVVLLVALAAAAYFFLFNSPEQPAMNSSGTEVTTQSESTKTTAGSALYVALPRPFVFNVPGSARDRMVQIKVQLLVRGKDNETLAMRHIPLIEGSLLETFSSANADELAQATGRDSLKHLALTNLQQALVEVVGSVVVDEVLFTGFVMQ